jgi:nucleotide-binding universal stress UspA family protein
MTIKTILVPLDGSEGSRNALKSGAQLARERKAHLEVVHVRTNPKDAVPLLGEGMSGAVIEDIITAAEKEAVERAQRAREIFESECPVAEFPRTDNPAECDGASTMWYEETGREDEIVAYWGRLADIIIINRPTDDSAVSATMTLNAALVETGRAVLVVPPNGTGSFGRNVAISWNGSSEAARAVAASMSLIESAEKVTIFTMNGEDNESDVAGQLARYLAWHGVSADIETTYVGDHNVGEVLVTKCTECNADVLIMGAYTHSRLRQLIFGGVTRHVLAEAKLPVVMVH